MAGLAAAGKSGVPFSLPANEFPALPTSVPVSHPPVPAPKKAPAKQASSDTTLPAFREADNALDKTPTSKKSTAKRSEPAVIAAPIAEPDAEPKNVFEDVAVPPPANARALMFVQVLPNAEKKQSRKDRKKEKAKEVDKGVATPDGKKAAPEPAATPTKNTPAPAPVIEKVVALANPTKKTALTVETASSSKSATDAPTPSTPAALPATPAKASAAARPIKPTSTPATPTGTAFEVPAPMVSKMPKKFKPPVAKPTKAKEETPAPESERAESQAPPDVHQASSSGDSTIVLDGVENGSTRATLADLIDQLLNRDIDLEAFAFFNPSHIATEARTPLKYGPLVHALSALSVGGGSFANTLPSGSIDTAVSSFQQLLETLTQTISDLLRLLPRNTWDDSSSFDGVLRDMLKGDDFLDENGEGRATPGPSLQEQVLMEGREDEVAVLTQALEKRARWMEVQLAKLEELHRDINNAAVRAVLSLNDAGWDRIAPEESRFEHVPAAFLPRTGGTLQRYDDMTANAIKLLPADLEAQLAEARLQESEAEDALMQIMETNAHLLGEY